jgi:CRP-like cAMP-binding protein
MADPRAGLLKSSALDDLTLEERRQVVELLEFETYPQGEAILREGRQTQILWFVLTGKCEVVKSLKPGSEQRFAVLESGAIFGEMSFISPAPHSATVRTLSEVEVARLSRANYNRLLDVSPSAAYKIALKILNVLSARLRRMDDWTCTLVDSNNAEAERRRQEWQEFRTKLYSEWQF